MLTSGSSFPRPEYPRPDRQRGFNEGIDWLNLNGPWQFRFDAERVGVGARWFSPLERDWRQQIIVPFCWESLAAWGEGESAGKDHYFSDRVFLDPLRVTAENHRSAPRFEVGWYRRTVTIPTTEGWRDRQIILTIGAADFFTDCWCNGVHIGRHEGGYDPIEFDLTATLAPTIEGATLSALIVIRVEDPMENHEQPVGKQWGWYTTTSGIWQTVFLEPRPTAHIDSFQFFPDIDAGTVQIDVHCRDTPDDAAVTAEITCPNGAVFNVGLRRSGEIMRSVVVLPTTVLWETFDPKLYRVSFQLSLPHSGTIDRVRGYFGMRKLAASAVATSDHIAQLSFNHRTVYLRGALYQSYHADGVYTASTSAVLYSDLLAAKEAGFDLIRVHLKLDDPVLLYHADQLGILIMQDFPNFGEGGDTPLGRQRFETMLRAGIKRDFNHPSIVAWCVFNETWGFGGQAELIRAIRPATGEMKSASPPGKISNRSSFTWIHQMWLLAKQLDPTRLIEDMSVVRWDHVDEFGHVDTDINSWHFYLNDYERAKKHIAEVVAATFQGSTYNYVEGFSQRAAPLINSEYGGVGALDGNRDVSWTFKFLTNELRRHPQLCAYIYTELTDVEWEHNGFLNYDRSKKEFGYDPTLVNRGDVLPINAPPIRRVAPGETIEVEILSSHFGFPVRRGITLHWIFSGVDSLGNWHAQIDRGHAPIDFPPSQTVLAQRISLRMPHDQMVGTLSVTAQTAEGEVIAENFVQHFVDGPDLPPLEDFGHFQVWRQHVWDFNEAQWTGPTSDRDSARSTGFCYGEGTGYFEWTFDAEVFKHLGKALRLRIVVELSTRKHDIAQTGPAKTPGTYDILLNDTPIHAGLIPDHPHDSRGVLSYLRGTDGAHGYLIHAKAEHSILQEIAAKSKQTGRLRLRLAALKEPIGGLTVFDFNCGRFPLGPTLIVEWNQ